MEQFSVGSINEAVQSFTKSLREDIFVYWKRFRNYSVSTVFVNAIS